MSPINPRTPPTKDQMKRAKICDRLFEAHSSINRAIAFTVGQIMGGSAIAPELMAVNERLHAIVTDAMLDCDKMK